MFFKKLFNSKNKQLVQLLVRYYKKAPNLVMANKVRVVYNLYEVLMVFTRYINFNY